MHGVMFCCNDTLTCKTEKYYSLKENRKLADFQDTEINRLFYVLLCI